MSKIVVGFVGMTHLGLVSATGTCSKGFNTICYDPDKTLIEELQSGKLPVLEPDLDDALAANVNQQRFTANLSDLNKCDTVYIATDVPTDDHGQSDLTKIEELINEVIPNLNDQAILVILCQVPPGFTRQLSMPHDRLYYQVETLIFGRALERATKPERFIIGAADPEIPMPDNYRLLLEAFDCPLLHMRYESAELAKISINMCLVASISVANTLAELCESIGAAWHEIVPALKLDKRIGQYSYLTPGLGIAGGNLERDLATVIRFSEKHHTDAGVVKAFITNSIHRKEWASKIFNEQILPKLNKPKVTIWGLAYKENTHSVKNSPSLVTINKLNLESITVHDPVVRIENTGFDHLIQAESALDAVKQADVLMILTPWPEYKEHKPENILKLMNGKVIVDPYSVMDITSISEMDIDYYTLGIPPISYRT